LPDTKARRRLPPRQARAHWSPAPGFASRATASCHECGFPIDGRFVALAGAPERFHPHCFSCYTCGTSLEALEISPEPDSFREERLARFARRVAGDTLDEEPGKTAADDGDQRLRFYCHLDWHELFAPKCRHCKTPILGEHVVALGQHWHYGHFFCAECGDPFEQGMTHIEKDGYAWCVNCQTKRTERRAPKCRKCRKAVIGQYVVALGGEWHDGCFRCATCRGSFDDGQIFPKEGAGEGIVICTKCRATELKQ
jgi:LIM domain